MFTIIITVYSANQPELSGKNTELFNYNPGDTYVHHCPIKGSVKNSTALKPYLKFKTGK
jgi:hypothetical protein